MKKFKYRFEPLLKVKSEIEKQKQKEFAQVKQKVNSQTQEIQQVDKNFDNSLNKQRQVQKNKISVAEMLVYGRYFVKLKKENLSNNEMLKALNVELEKTRKSLVESTTEKKKYEKLKENLLIRYKSDFTKAETKDNDEIASNNYSLKGSILK
ncbi:MAG: flagellar export protein FliJ [candidate division Zixibacteria bacterium]|nr:flagellar export protein FliJ [candidate division Zixibacteria bacterium]